jgi:hypothetical protein
MAVVEKKLGSKEAAQLFVEKAAKYGFHWSVSLSGVVTVKKSFAPGDKDAYVGCDMMGPSVLDYAPGSGGSIWGTDGGSIGGMSGLNGGYYKLNKSGVNKNFCKALTKLAP